MELEPGEYNIEVSQSGFKTQTGTINLYSNMNIEVVLKKKKKKSKPTYKKKSPVYTPVKKDWTSMFSSTSVNGAACKGCHGQDWGKKALGRSKVAEKMRHNDISAALRGYKAGT